jgi:hypothetical protein
MCSPRGDVFVSVAVAASKSLVLAGPPSPSLPALPLAEGSSFIPLLSSLLSLIILLVLTSISTAVRSSALIPEVHPQGVSPPLLRLSSLPSFPLSPEFDANFHSQIFCQYMVFSQNIGGILAQILAHHYLANTPRIRGIYAAFSRNPNMLKIYISQLLVAIAIASLIIYKSSARRYSISFHCTAPPTRAPALRKPDHRPAPMPSAWARASLTSCLTFLDFLSTYQSFSR